MRKLACDRSQIVQGQQIARANPENFSALITTQCIETFRFCRFTHDLCGFHMDLFGVLTLDQEFTITEPVDVLRIAQEDFSKEVTPRKDRDQALDDAWVPDKVRQNGTVSFFQQPFEIDQGTFRVCCRGKRSFEVRFDHIEGCPEQVSDVTQSFVHEFIIPLGTEGKQVSKYQVDRFPAYLFTCYLFTCVRDTWMKIYSVW